MLKCLRCGRLRKIEAKGFCKSCYTTLWRSKNREKYNASRRRAYRRNHKRELARFKEYRSRYGHKIIERNRRYFFGWVELLKDHFGKICCQKCGYDKTFAALQFHHFDRKPEDQHFSVILKYNPDSKWKYEIKKGTLLCANCHIEEHHGETNYWTDYKDKGQGNC